MAISAELRRKLGGSAAAATVLFAFLVIGPAAIGMPIGFASLNGGTTGGASGPTVIATTAGQFVSLAEQNGPMTILVDGNLSVGQVEIESNKTILGVGSTAGLVGNIKVDNANNVILRNLSLSNPTGLGTGDTVEVSGSTNVWIDHNNVFDSTDGLLDIVRESDFVTVSWNKFFYTQDYADNVNTGHRFAMLIGNSDGAIEDADNLRVTLHHNHWGDNVRERMPRVRYGDVHVYNNYFNSPGNNYAVRAAQGSELLIESNYFEDVDDPFEKMNDSIAPLVEASGNIFVNTTGDTDAGDNVFDPPYAYTLHDALDVKSHVLAHAGVGQIPEPSTIALLGIFACACLMTKHRSQR